MAIQTGDLVVVTYEEREFTAIVIDPNGLGEGEPSVGFGFRMASRHIGIPQQTLTAYSHDFGLMATFGEAQEKR